MSGWLAAVAARATQVVRVLWPGRNPLRRAVDRVEGAVVVALAVAFLAGAPLAGVAAYGYGAHAGRVQRAVWHQVPAVLLATALPSATSPRRVPDGRSPAGRGASVLFPRRRAPGRAAR